MSNLTKNFKKYNLDIKGVRLPSFDIDENEKKEVKAAKNCSNIIFLKKLCAKKMEEIKTSVSPEEYKEYQERARKEIDILEELSFIDYILLVWDVIRFCKREGVATGMGRGCLDYDSLVLSNSGAKKLGEIEIGDIVTSHTGRKQKVIDKLEYDCDEKLIGFKTYCSSFSRKFMTKDHKVLSLKNPFKRNSEGYVTKLSQNYNLEEIFKSDKLEWNEAKDLGINDYLVRYVGRTAPIEDISAIDLSGFADYFDKDFVYERHPINKEHPLSIRTIHKETGISRSCLKNIKNQKETVREQSLTKIKEYLNESGYDLNQFINFNPYIEKKYPRYLNVDEDFCYALGFFLGDGWWHKDGSRIGFAFNSISNKKELNILEEYFKSLGAKTNPIKHAQKNLTQLMVNSGIFCSLFRHLVPFKRANKKIPSEYLNLPDKKLYNLLQGLIASDGHINKKNNRICFDNTSLNLVYQVRWLLELFGYGCRINQRKQEGCNISYKVTSAKRTVNNTCYYNNGEYLFVKIKDIIHSNNKKGKVYDITVEEDHSYSTDEFIVHNSAAGSLILYLIGVTKIDPLKYDLYFERFVSKVRAKKQVVDGVTYLDGALMADVDLDICYYDRGKVLKYLEEKFKSKTSKILTLNTLSGKLVMRECGRIVSEKEESELNKVTDMIPKKYGIVKDIYESYDEVEEFKEWCDENENVFNTACKLRGLIKNKSIHASAILLSYDDLEETCPTELDANKESLVSAYDAKWVSMFNVKLDVLGLRGVSVVQQTFKNIEKDFGKKFTQEEIVEKIGDYNNLWIYLQDLRSKHGLFQIEADTAFKVCKSVQPKNIEQLSAVLALARPGAIDFLEQYTDTIQNPENYKSIHNFFDEQLKKTGGVALYQEQLMKMAHAMGFTLDDAETLRRIVGKKKTNEVKKWKEKVQDLVSKNKNLQEKNEEGQNAGEVFWKILEDSSNYSFNKCLSPDTVVETPNGDKMLFEINKGDQVLAYNESKGVNHYVEVINTHESKVDLFEIEMDDGRKIKCSLDHKFLCKDGQMRPVKEIFKKKLEIMCKD